MLRHLDPSGGVLEPRSVRLEIFQALVQSL